MKFRKINSPMYRRKARSTMVGILVGEFLGPGRTSGSDCCFDNAWSNKARFGECVGLCGWGNDSCGTLGTISGSLESEPGRAEIPTACRNNNTSIVEKDTTDGYFSERIPIAAMGITFRNSLNGGDRVMFAVNFGKIMPQ